MTRTRTISTTALVSLLGAAMPAFAQAPAPAPMYAPAPAPMMAPALEPAAVMPVAPIVVPRSPDDMSGSIGFGVGLQQGTSLVVPNTASVAMKIWVNDTMALVPQLIDQVTKEKDSDTQWRFAPAILLDFTLLKGASTRFNGGAGIGLDIFGQMKEQGTGANDPTRDFGIAFAIPVQLAVEHFFTRWLSISLGTTFDLVRATYSKTDPTSTWKLTEEISNFRYMGSLFIYTD